jgi:hypothetical protein
LGGGQKRGPANAGPFFAVWGQAAYLADTISALRSRRAIILRINLRRISSRGEIRPLSTIAGPQLGVPGKRAIFSLSSMRRPPVFLGQEGANLGGKAQAESRETGQKSPFCHD